MGFKQPNIAGRDDVMGHQSHCRELLRRGVIRKNADLLACASYSSKQLRHSGKKAASQITEWPRFNPFRHDRVDAFGRHRSGLGRFGDQNALEVQDLLGSQVLFYAPVGADDAYGIQVTFRKYESPCRAPSLDATGPACRVYHPRRTPRDECPANPRV
jgi:hypothetical protein